MSVCLYVAMRLTKEYGSFPLLVLAAFITALIDMLPIPYVGGLVSLVVLLLLISRFTTAEVWPDAVLIVVVSWFFAGLASMAVFKVLVLVYRLYAKR